MIVTIPKDADFAEFLITAQHNPNYLVVKVDGVITTFDYEDSTVKLTDLKEGQVVEITEETPSHTIEGEAPIEAIKLPTITRIKFKINSLGYLPEPVMVSEGELVN